MRITNNPNPIKTNISFGVLVPIKNYSGPILKLTKEDKDKINILQKSISQLEIELYKLKNYFGYKQMSTQTSNYYADKFDNINFKIENLREMIKEIKISRLKSQQKSDQFVRNN